MTDGSTHKRLPWRRLVGEFFVIVTGVLVALGADALNDARLEREEEREYLTRLRAEVIDDTANYRFILDWIDLKEDGLERLDDLFSEPGTPFAADTVLADLTAAANFGWNVGPLVGEATFEDLRSSGKLGLIRNAELRSQIIRYYEESESEDRRLQARRTPYPLLSYQLVSFVRVPGEADEFAAADDVGALLQELRDSELPGYVRAEANRARFIRASITGMRSIAVELMNAISGELGAS